jgi:hypothetical protein
MLKWYDAYVSVGLKPIAIFCGTKIPVGQDWNKNWEPNKWRDYFKSDSYNMGILLGEIIDVEGDTSEANNFLLEMIGDTEHPMFSSSKSIHHLFLNPDPKLTRWSFNGIEFRGHKHQSVVPPSVHDDGTPYKWMVNSNSYFKIPNLPPSLLDFYFQNKNLNKNKFSQKHKNKPGHKRTECKKCGGYFYIHKKRLILEVKAFAIMGQLWSCHGCRQADVKEMCRSIRKNLNKDQSSRFFPVWKD